jgi:hypothetical protein
MPNARTTGEGNHGPAYAHEYEDFLWSGCHDLSGP